MVLGKRWSMGTGVVAAAACGALALGAPGSATAAPAKSSAKQAAQIEQVTLRLASDPGQVANVRGASTENLAPVIQWPWSGETNERWNVDDMGGGYHRFRAVHSDKCLNVKGGGNADDTQVIQYTCGSSSNEQWKFVPKGKGYQIVAKSSGKCLNVRGGVGQGRNLIQYTCTVNGAANDVWLPVWETPLT